jgi:hypothetical protein
MSTLTPQQITNLQLDGSVNAPSDMTLGRDAGPVDPAHPRQAKRPGCEGRAPPEPID